MDRKRLLLIEDDQTIAELLAYNLRHVGYEVLQERDGRAGLDAALAYDVDLALIDLMLPELDGMAVSREIARKKPELPIIMLTALTDRATMLMGFENGADDYITKPFDLEEVLARIAARLRRSTPAVDKGTANAHEGLLLDCDAHTLRAQGGEVHLKPKEHDLLELLLSRPGHLFRREEITFRVWHHQYSPASRTLDVHIRHVRAKLQSIAAPLCIRNVRGVGYRAVLNDTEGPET